MSIERFSTGKPYEARLMRHSAAVRVDGDLLYTAGIVGRDDAGKLVEPNNMASQAAQITRSIQDILTAGGTSAEHIVKLTTYVTDIDAYLAARDATQPLFVNKPASTLIEIRKLAAPDILIEIEAVAYVPNTPAPSTPARTPFGTGKPWEANARHAPGNKTGVPLVFTAGVTGRNPDGAIVPGGMAEQTRQAVANLIDALKAGGSDPSRIVKMILFATDVDGFMAEGMAECAPVYGDKPSSTLIGVTRLQDPGLLFEIEAVAEADR